MQARTFSRLQRALLKIYRLPSRMRGGQRYHWQVAWVKNQAWAAPHLEFLRRDADAVRGYKRILDRRFQLLQFIEAVRQLSGSTLECGVFRGVGSGLICQALERTYAHGQRHFGFDSFEGLSEPLDADRMQSGEQYWRLGQLHTPLAATQELLAKFPFCELHQGWIPECFSPAADHQFRFVHIDVDLREPTLASLEFCYPRMVKGGVLVLDDHGFANCPGARSAACDFFADKPEQIIDLATGQAFVMKA